MFMVMYSGFASRLRPLCTLCRKNVWSEYRFQLKYTAAPAQNAPNFRKRGRVSHRTRPSFNVNDASMKNLLDDELYFDRDFDYVDQQQLSLQRKLNDKYLFSNDTNNSPKAIIGRKYRNALYDDDEDDLKLAQVKLNAGNSKQTIKKLHRQFEEERLETKKNANHELLQTTSESVPQNNVSLSKSRIEKKKESRVLMDLPFDITPENRFDTLNQLVIPYYKMPYHMQLKQKHQMNVEILRRLGNKLHQMDGPVRIGRNGLACPLEPTRASPVTESYRNKDEFSVWPGIDGNGKTVGFFVGQPSLHKQVICVEPVQMVISKQSHRDIAAKFQQYLREVSPYDYCHNYGEAGNWRRLSIRSNHLQQHMVTASMHPQELSEEELREEMDRLAAYFADDTRISSLHFHTSRHTRSTHSQERYYHLAGSPTIAEQLFDRHFTISPSSFFQVKCAKVLVNYHRFLD